MQKIVLRIAAFIVAATFVVLAAATLTACGEEEEPETGKSLSEVILSAQPEVRGYEWGPGVPKLTIKFSGSVGGADVSTFTVNAGGTTRTVTKAYASDASGMEVSGDSEYLTLEMETRYNEASPFTYDMATQQNDWSDSISYTVALASGKSVTVDGETVSSGSKSFAFTREDMRSPDTEAFEKDTFSYGDIELTRAYFAPDGAEDDGAKNPLVIWLHGMGEGGTDVEIALLGNEVTALARDEIQSYFTSEDCAGAYVLAIQTPTMWMDADGAGSMNSEVTGKPQTSYYTDALFAAITDYVQNNPDVDTDRIYLGGCSNGGYMTMNMMFEHGDYFAAYYPVCEAYMNGNISDEMIDSISEYDIWFVHSEDDTTVDPLATTIPTYYRLLAAGAGNIRFTLTDHVRGTDDPDPAWSWGVEEGCYMGHWVWIYLFNDEVNTYFDNAEAAADLQNVTISGGSVTSTDNYLTSANCTEEGNIWEWMAAISKGERA